MWAHGTRSRRELCGCRDCSYLHTLVASETSEVISYALSSLARLADSRQCHPHPMLWLSLHLPPLEGNKGGQIKKHHLAFTRS